MATLRQRYLRLRRWIRMLVQRHLDMVQGYNALAPLTRITIPRNTRGAVNRFVLNVAFTRGATGLAELGPVPVTTCRYLFNLRVARRLMSVVDLSARPCEDVEAHRILDLVEVSLLAAQANMALTALAISSLELDDQLQSMQDMAFQVTVPEHERRMRYAREEWEAVVWHLNQGEPLVWALELVIEAMEPDE